MKKNFLETIKAIPSAPIKNDKLFVIDTNEPKNIIKNFAPLSKDPDFVMLSNILYKLIFKKDPTVILNAPIETIRIILTLAHQCRSVYFNQARSPMTASLFQDEFSHVKNSYVSFTIANSSISPARETKRIKQALEILSSDSIAQWVTTTNYKGEKVESLIRFIEKPSYTRGKFYVEMSTYWLEAMADIFSYNSLLWDLSYNVPNTRIIIFAIWLNTLPDYKEKQFSKETYKTWTKVSLESLQEKFGLQNKDSDYINQKFLKSIQKTLFEFNNLSFAFHYENKMYYITSINSKTNIAIDNLSETERYANSVKYSINYLQRRHKISSDSLKHIEAIYMNDKWRKGILEDAYSRLKKVVASEKNKMTDLVGNKFLSAWQEQIRLAYQDTEAYIREPHNHPNII